MSSNDQTLYYVCHSCVVNRKCLVFVILMLVFRAKSDDLPKNVVVMAGADKVLNCAEGEPFRWYRYLPSDPNNETVLFKGTRMADGIDKRYRVLKEPENFPFQRLDLIITDVQADHHGTYRCKLPQSSVCAELIVLSSEPNCKIHASKDSSTNDMVELRCSIDITENSQPEMLCSHQNEATLTETSCSVGDNGLVTCLAKVPAEMKTDYICLIKIKPRPRSNSKMCTYASNEPDYQYTWQSSSGVSDDVMAVSNQFSIHLLIGVFVIVLLIVSAMLNIILSLVVYCQRRRMKGHSSGKNSASSSAETLTSDCESLTTTEGQEDTKERQHLDSESSLIPSPV